MLVVVLGGILKSFNQGLLGAALAFMSVAPDVSTQFIAVFAGIGAAAQILSSLAVGWVAERLGVRRTLRLSALVAFLSVALFCSPGGPVLWMCGNVSKGLYIGVVAALLPVVLSLGVSSEKIERASGTFQLSQQVGGVLGAATGAAVAWAFGSDPLTALRVDFSLMALPAVFFAIALKGLHELPHAPRAADVSAVGGFAACDRAVLFMVLMSASGVGTVMEYLSVVFVRRGLDLADGCTVSAVVMALSVVAVILSTALVGRANAFCRVLLGALGMTFGLVGAALMHGCAFVVCLALASVSFAFGPGTCAWGLVPRLIAPPFRTRGTAVAIVAGQAVSLVLTTSFLPVLERLGLGFVLVAFAIMSTAMAVVAVVWGKKAGQR